MTGCTGGWCPRRMACEAYTDGKARDDVRLCERGHEQPRRQVTLLTELARSASLLELARSLQIRGAIPNGFTQGNA